jgi:hypothetical protein
MSKILAFGYAAILVVYLVAFVLSAIAYAWNWLTKPRSRQKTKDDQATRCAQVQDAEPTARDLFASLRDADCSPGGGMVGGSGADWCGLDGLGGI